LGFVSALCSMEGLMRKEYGSHPDFDAWWQENTFPIKCKTSRRRKRNGERHLKIPGYDQLLSLRNEELHEHRVALRRIFFVRTPNGDYFPGGGHLYAVFEDGRIRFEARAKVDDLVALQHMYGVPGQNIIHAFYFFNQCIERMEHFLSDCEKRFGKAE